MKRIIKIVCCVCVGILFCVLVISLCACTQDAVQLRSHYILNLVYDETKMSLMGEEKVIYVNTSENAFDKVYFHLYPNAFREGATAKVVSNSKLNEAYYDGVSFGNVKLTNVSFNDVVAEYTVEGEDENILGVCLQNTLFPDEQVEIYISFIVQLPKINHRLGVGEKSINFGNFYPIACVYENGIGFRQELYHSNGDPFYSECADYDVTIEHSDCFTMASTGSEQSAYKKDGKIITNISASNVRDFCFVLSQNFEVESQTIEGVAVNYYGYKGDDDLKTNLQIAVKALQTFNCFFGEYPYSSLSIVKSNFLHGGMEYPNIVLISDNVVKEDFGYVIVHEIAHQWWYGVVGNDQYNHAWMDEGLAEYSTLLFYKNNPEYGEDFEKMIANAEKSYKLYVAIYTKVNGSADGVMDKPVCDYATEPEYVQCTYTKGVLLMNAIKDSIGEKNFFKALKSYYNKFKFKLATPADFISVFIKASGGDMEGFINSWLYDKMVMG